MKNRFTANANSNGMKLKIRGEGNTGNFIAFLSFPEVRRCLAGERLITLFGVVFCCLANLALCATIHVPADYPTIQEGIDAAGHGDTVLVADGIYYGTGNLNITFSKDITLMSEHGPESTIIACDGVNARGFLIGYHGMEYNAILDGFTIRNGKANDEGGGIRCIECNTIIRNCIVTGNSSEQDGGGLYADQYSFPIIESCVFSNNRTLRFGGGIGFEGSSFEVRDSYLHHNTAGSGGGLFCWDFPDPDYRCIVNCTVSYNIARGGGGGIGGFDTGSLNIYNTIIANNQSGAGGGGGGGVEVASASTPSLFNCLITKNMAEILGGGMIFETSAIATLNNCTIVSNVAMVGGGMVCTHNSTAAIANSIFWDDMAPDGPEIRVAWSGSPSHVTASFSDIEGGLAAVSLDAGCTFEWGEGDIDVDPQFAVGIGADYCLSQRAAGQDADSPCVDAGNGAAATTCIDEEGLLACMSEGSTRTDLSLDEGAVDMGYHLMAISPSPTPASTATSIPTATPEITSTATSAISITPSPTPSSSPTVAPTPTSEPPSLGVRLVMPTHQFAPGDPCRLDAQLYNDGPVLSQIPLFVLLDIYGGYWFWDSWLQSLDYAIVDVHAGITTLPVIAPFNWPDTGGDALDGLVFWGALTDPAFTAILGGEDGIGYWELSYGPYTFASASR